jgi:aminopeptidase 2
VSLQLSFFDSKIISISVRSIYSDAFKSAQPAIFASFDEKQHRTVYQLADTLPAESKAELSIVFTGKLTESSEGYFWSSWEKDGKTQNYALTQFEVRPPDLCYI